MEATLVRVDVAAGVATITLDSPHNRNALSRLLVSQLLDALRRVAADPSARVVVLTAAGHVFCSGADLKEQREADPTATLALLPDVISAIWAAPQPVVCRLPGLARAGGVGLLAACDVVVAPDDVTFSFTEVRLGLVPAIITVPLLRRVPQHIVHRLFLTGEVFDAARAREIGLLDEIRPAGEVDGAVDDVVAMLLRAGPEALALTKQVVRSVSGLETADAFARMVRLSGERFASEEGREGMLAFAEKREPAWISGLSR